MVYIGAGGWRHGRSAHGEHGVENMDDDKYIGDQSFNDGQSGLEQYSNVEILLMMICVLLFVLVLINLSKFCYQIYKDKKQTRDIIREKKVDTDDELECS